MEHADIHRRHTIIWALTRPAADAILAAKFNFRGEKSGLKGPLLILSNHCSDWDPGFIVSSFREQVYFVTSEHLLRLGPISKLLVWAQDPIARQKGGSAAAAVREILRRLKSGYSVCFFPEGNRTWDGVTRPFPPATGKLAKICGATLVTYKTEGAYLSNPRWAGPSLRRGRVRGAVAGVYPPEKLRSMTEGEINDAIALDLYEDAFARARTEMTPFAGERIAEGLETLLFTCPKCGAMHRMVSADDLFYCSACGYRVRYQPTGFFAGRDMIFDNVRDWNYWQDGKIEELCREAGEEPIFQDDGVELFSVTTGRGARSLGRGSITLYRDRLEMSGGVVIPLCELTGMSIRGASDMFIGVSGDSYQVCADGVCCTAKYLTACSYLGCPVSFGV